jgi:acetyl-CoA carboxylase alpha subunit
MTQVDVDGRRENLMEKTQDKVDKLETQLKQWREARRARRQSR